MLVLTRKVDEFIQIGEVTVKVVAVHGSRVRLGIEAPRDVCITRTPTTAKEDHAGK